MRVCLVIMSGLKCKGGRAKETRGVSAREVGKWGRECAAESVTGKSVESHQKIVFIHVYIYLWCGCGCLMYNTPLHCNTLQHTATHCNTLQRCNMGTILCDSKSIDWPQDSGNNTLQHTATHCNTRNTLQHTAPHCTTLQRTATHCNTATYCNTLQHTATHA